MPFIEKPALLEKFRTLGRNSSHFIWLLAELKAYECANGWIFGFVQLGDVTLLALEPLIPGAPTSYSADDIQAFRNAWEEFASVVHPKISAFVAVYKPFCAVLEAQGFQWIKAGEEPWVDLEDCIPKGNAGKGVRSARNQALHAGLRVEEWSASQIESDPEKRRVMEEIYAEWSGTRLVALTGFMNSTDPFAHMQERRYFALRSDARIEGYLVATPVPGIQSHFLEDLVIRRDAPRGAGELVTLEAMVALRLTGGQHASLGVVSMSRMDASSASQLPRAVRFFMQTVPAYFGAIYNFNGMETYRKRFKPHAWQSIHLCVKNHTQPEASGSKALSDSRAWLKVLVALLIAFKPRLQLTPAWLARAVSKPVRDYPLTAFLATLNFLSFAVINRFGELPPRFLARFGFSASAPFSEWLTRSVVSDFLYFDRPHFLFWGVAYCLMVFWAEKKHKLNFLVPFLLSICVFDDVINYLVVIKPFQHFQPGIFKDLIAVKDVGSSLSLATLVGLQLHQFKKLREPLFAIILFGLVLAFAFTSAQMQFLVMNLNHVLFLLVGFLTGKVLFEYQRTVSRHASKGKPPAGKCVLPPQERAPSDRRTPERKDRRKTA